MGPALIFYGINRTTHHSNPIILLQTLLQYEITVSKLQKVIDECLLFAVCCLQTGHSIVLRLYFDLIDLPRCLDIRLIMHNGWRYVSPNGAKDALLGELFSFIVDICLEARTDRTCIRRGVYQL